MELIFTPTTKAEIDIIVAFSRQLNEDDPVATGEVKFDEQIVRAAMVNFVDDPSLGRAWLIYDGHEPIGYVILTLGYSLEYHGRDAFIDELFIKAGHRGQGVGRKVMRFVEDEAGKLGVNALHLEVEQANTRAVSLYHKLGYEDHKRYLLTKWLK